MITLLLILLATLTGGSLRARPEHVEEIEVNHVFQWDSTKEEFKQVYTQVIVWELNTEEARRDIRSYFIVDDANRDEWFPSRIPGGFWVFQCRHYDRTIRLTTRHVSETWTAFDPERENARHLSSMNRRSVRNEQPHRRLNLPEGTGLDNAEEPR